jgi:DNA-binding GntR family transcriptional regulator
MIEHESVPGTIPYFLKEQIRRAIVDGTFHPGQPLREQDLEKRYASSRGPIREALRMLEHIGLVTHIQRRGFRVTLYSEKEIRDQYLLRAELQSYALLQLAQIDDLRPLLKDLAECHQRMALAFGQRDPSAYLKELRYFFDATVGFLGNAPLEDAHRRLCELAEPLRYNLLSRRLDQSKSLQYTKKIMMAIKARDFERAAALKREHVLLNLPSIIETYVSAQYGRTVEKAG